MVEISNHSSYLIEGPEAAQVWSLRSNFARILKFQVLLSSKIRGCRTRGRPRQSWATRSC